MAQHSKGPQEAPEACRDNALQHAANFTQLTGLKISHGLECRRQRERRKKKTNIVRPGTQKKKKKKKKVRTFQVLKQSPQMLISV